MRSTCINSMLRLNLCRLLDKCEDASLASNWTTAIYHYLNIRADLTVFANLQAASADVYQFLWLFWPGISSDLVRLPHPQHKLHPAWINSPPLKTFIDICRCSDAQACLSWPFSSQTPLQFNSNLGLVDVGWQVETSQWDADGHLHSRYKGKAFSHLDRVANCVKTRSDQDNGLWRNEISSLCEKSDCVDGTVA